MITKTITTKGDMDVYVKFRGNPVWIESGGVANQQTSNAIHWATLLARLKTSVKRSWHN